MSDSVPSKLSRRRVFAGAGAVGALAGAAAVLPLVKPPEAVAEKTKPTPEPGDGYQVTEHVLRYYRTTRI